MGTVSDGSAAWPPRPLLIYDGGCGFCRRQVARWRDRTGERVEYAPSQEVASRYPQVAPELFDRGVVLLVPGGDVLTGALAVFTALRHSPAGRCTLWAYRRVPGFAPVAESLYRFTARHRHAASTVSRLLAGRNPAPDTYGLATWIFLRLVGVTFLIAFMSLWTQIHGLVGDDGILPAVDYLAWARENIGPACYRALPTVCWLSTDGAFLDVLCGAGVLSAVLLIVGVVPIPTLALLWLLYLSLSVVGQTFMSFQWDSLLLETGLVAMFLAPARWRPAFRVLPRPAAAGIIITRLLLFKLMFLSGVTKLLSGEPAWRDLSALDIHYQTQPLPSWIGWYAHQLPGWFQRASVANMYVIEIGLPLLIIAPRRVRHGAACGMLLLQLLIAATGSYCFFNLLAATLCVLLLDDQLLRRLLPRGLRDRITVQARPVLDRTGPRVLRYAANTAAAAIVVISACAFLREMVRTVRRPAVPAVVVTILDIAGRHLLGTVGNELLALTDPLRTINGYGLFRIMTPERPEIIIEASNDGVVWSEYRLPFKPGDVQQRPRFTAGHQPRLDWQMWFAALNPDRAAYWLGNLADRLLEGSPAVLDLFAENPFPGRPPRYVRFVYYRYEFTDMATKRRTGHWWRREWVRPLTMPISRGHD